MNKTLIQCYVPPRQTHVPADWAIVLYDEGQQSETDYVLLSWRPVTVSVSVPDDLPAANVRVDLTVEADAPSDATYQWQQRSSGASWTDLGSAEVSEARGTRQYRVTVSHTTALSATSQPVFVTWDALDIWGDLSTDLAAAVTGDSEYASKQTALLTCMNEDVAADDQYGSFEDILADYANAKAKLEDTNTCKTEADEMLSTNQRVTQAKLTALRNSNSDYAGVLGTPQGGRFVAIAGNTAETKRLLNLATNAAAPGEIEFPVYDEVQANDTVQARSSSPSQTLTQAELEQGTGLDCLPSRVRGEDLTLTNKLRVLNCLVFDTPHSFWLDYNVPDFPDVSDLRQEMAAGGRYAWIGQKAQIDWVCTKFFDGPVPSCKKHDVAYGGLQSFAGPDTSRANGNTLDEAWNPRNKALADDKFKADIVAHGCQQQSVAATLVVCWWPRQFMAARYFNGVAHVNNKHWPVTTTDISNIRSSMRFKNCGEPPVPAVSDVSASKDAQDGRTIVMQWIYSPGCAEISPSDVILWVQLRTSGQVSMPSHGVDSRSCEVTGSTMACRLRLADVPGLTVFGADIYVAPKSTVVEYGRDNHYGELGTKGRFKSFRFDTPLEFGESS